jgi:hypothetical protein
MLRHDGARNQRARQSGVAAVGTRRPSRTWWAKSRHRDYVVSVASTSEGVAKYTEEEPIRCLARGKSLEGPLSTLGSLRCLDCREANAPLNAELVALWQQQGSHF